MSGDIILTSGVLMHWEQYQFGARGVVRVSLSVENPSEADQREVDAFIQTLLPASAMGQVTRQMGTEGEIDEAIARFMTHDGAKRLLVN